MKMLEAAFDPRREKRESVHLLSFLEPVGGAVWEITTDGLTWPHRGLTPSVRSTHGGWWWSWWYRRPSSVEAPHVRRIKKGKENDMQDLDSHSLLESSGREQLYGTGTDATATLV